MKSSGKGMWKNRFDREMPNPFWRKLCCWCQIGVSDLQISNCRRSSKERESLVCSSLFSVEVRMNIQVSLVRYTFGRSLVSPFIDSSFYCSVIFASLSGMSYCSLLIDCLGFLG